jgi:hypothetical protein
MLWAFTLNAKTIDEQDINNPIKKKILNNDNPNMIFH